jgi:hypothetical protein
LNEAKAMLEDVWPQEQLVRVIGRDIENLEVGAATPQIHSQLRAADVRHLHVGQQKIYPFVLLGDALSSLSTIRLQHVIAASF